MDSETAWQTFQVGRTASCACSGSHTYQDGFLYVLFRGVVDSLQMALASAGSAILNGPRGSVADFSGGQVRVTAPVRKMAVAAEMLIWD
jgi:hypothetical protein